MNTFAIGFTLRSLCSVPVVLIAILWAIVTNFGDAVHNGTQRPLQRLIVVTAAVLIQFGLTWLFAHLIPSRVDARLRAGLILVMFLLASLIRAFLIAFTLALFNEQNSIVLTPRLYGAIAQSLEISAFTVAYGLLLDAATKRQALKATEHRLSSLANETQSASQVESAKLIERVRAQLRRSLTFTESIAPIDLVHMLNQSIEDMVRPLSRALRIDASEHTVADTPANAARIDWRSSWTNTLAGDSIQIGITWALFTVTVLTPTVTLFGGSLGLAWSLFISSIMSIGLWLGMRVTQRNSPFLRRWRTLFAMAFSSAVGGLTLWFVFPRELVLSYILITPIAVSISTLVPALTTSALRQSHEISERLETRNTQLAWTIARNTEKTRQRRSIIAAALHGTVQAALAASSLRLQIALRDGTDIESAAAQARDNAQKAIDFNVLDSDTERPLAEKIHELRDSWADLIEVRASIPFSAIDADPICSRLIAELATEGVLNAVKHAQANWVSIECSMPHDRTVTLTISNPIVAESTTGPGGGGTKLLEGAAIRWDRSIDEQLLTLSAALPWEEHP